MNDRMQIQVREASKDYLTIQKLLFNASRDT